MKKGKLWEVSKKELENLLETKKSIKEVLNSLGYKYSSRHSLEKRCKQDNIDYKSIIGIKNGCKKSSPIWKISKNELLEIAKEPTLTAMLSKFGLNNIGGNHNTLKNRFLFEGIDYSHVYKYVPVSKEYTYDEIFCENSKADRRIAKRKIIKEDLIDYKCCECKISSEWNGKELTLILDHINGIRNDNRLNNLRFLCPNCNSQTSTFAGRNIKEQNRKRIKQEGKKYYCRNCQEIITKKAKICVTCSRMEKAKKSKCPTRIELILELSKPNWTWVSLGTKYGVSDNAVRKWVKKYEIDINFYNDNRWYS